MALIMTKSPTVLVPRSTPIGAQHHRRRKSEREDHRLPGIEHGERDVGFYAGVLVARHRAVVALGFARLGGEIFDRLVVEQRIDRLGVGVGVALVHFAADIDPPFGRIIGELHIEHDRDADDGDVAPVEMQQQHRDDQRQFDDGRRELQQHHAHDRLDSVAAALEDACQPAGLALEMKAQRKQMHVLEGQHRQPAHRVHRDFGENAVAPLRQQPHHNAHAAIGERHHHRSSEGPGEPIARRQTARCRDRPAHRSPI